jgi:hypothetical protein
MEQSMVACKTLHARSDDEVSKVQVAAESWSKVKTKVPHIAQSSDVIGKFGQMSIENRREYDFQHTPAWWRQVDHSKESEKARSDNISPSTGGATSGNENGFNNIIPKFFSCPRFLQHFGSIRDYLCRDEEVQSEAVHRTLPEQAC